MPQVHVCCLSLVPVTVAATRASHLVSLIDDNTIVERPPTIPAERHLFIGINDITEPTEGLIAPALEHVEQLLAFVEDWDRRNPMVVHCYAGISRSTAAAFIALCAANPGRAEAEIAWKMRAASPTATPNSRIVAFGDALLRRNGRMIAAAQAIGRGEMAVEGIPFAIAIEN